MLVSQFRFFSHTLDLPDLDCTQVTHSSLIFTIQQHLTILHYTQQHDQDPPHTPSKVTWSLLILWISSQSTPKPRVSLEE